MASGRALREPQFDGSQPFWIEGRPEESGRSVIMSLNADGKAVDVTPVGYDARTKVHEYGGGAYAVSRGLVVFANFADGRLYRHTVGDEPDPLTEDRPLRYADLRVDGRRARVLCVVEDHSPEDAEPRNTIGAISLANGSLTELVSGADFFSDPRLDPAGERLAWLCWSRPNMPWDGTELWVGQLSADGLIADAARIAGGPDESIVQPTWAPDGSLLFASDRNGWWNLYRWRGEDGQVQAPAPMQAEFADPQWVFGQTHFASLSDGRVAAIANAEGQDRLLVLCDGEAPAVLDVPYSQLPYIAATGTSVLLVAGSPAEPTAVVQLDVDTAAPSILRKSGEPPIGPEWISMPEAIEFPTTGGLKAHGLLYEPVNPRVSGPADDRPPLIVISHGGPTAQASSRFNASIQFFTTRGFAVVDVDYRGSTGYGRAYRERLLGQWGVVDLEDCVNAARWLAWRGTVDGARMAIRGGSAGGYTTLCALCFTDVFACGTSYFGVADLEALARFTHKFESRYLDRMVAPYPAEVELYRRRSPIHYIDRIHVPVLVLQGADDMVVLQAQADKLVETLAGNGVPYAYLLFQGEGHGFRRAENLRRSLEAELSFYGQVFGFAPADELPPLEVHGLADTDANQSTHLLWASRSTARPE